MRNFKAKNKNRKDSSKLIKFFGSQNDDVKEEEEKLMLKSLFTSKFRPNKRRKILIDGEVGGKRYSP